MTKREFKRKARWLATEASKAVYAEAVRLFASGAVDPAEYGDDFELPKICLTVALERAAGGYMPLTKCGKDQVQDLRHF
jgi:hypothetical protein